MTKEQRANKQMIRKSRKEEIFSGIAWSNFLWICLNEYYAKIDTILFIEVLLVIDVICYLSYIYELDLLFKNKTKEEEK